jgi:hypothetical protein
MKSNCQILLILIRRARGYTCQKYKFKENKPKTEGQSHEKGNQSKPSNPDSLSRKGEDGNSKTPKY